MRSAQARTDSIDAYDLPYAGFVALIVTLLTALALGVLSIFDPFRARELQVGSSYNILDDEDENDAAGGDVSRSPQKDATAHHARDGCSSISDRDSGLGASQLHDERSDMRCTS